MLRQTGRLKNLDHHFLKFSRGFLTKHRRVYIETLKKHKADITDAYSENIGLADILVQQDNEVFL